jgi:oxygen-dependent protoporphyrinogen oxidase
MALEQHRRCGVLEYILYESSPRLGGVLRTEHIQGCLVEAGPDSFITEKPWATDLCRKLGLGDQLIGSNDADRRTYIVVHSRLIPIPDGLMFMVPTKILPTGFSPLFSWKTKLCMAQEFFHPPRVAGTDESVASFVDRHYGAEMVDRLADPLLSGIYGGRAASLSVRAVLPRFSEMERSHGSLGRAMLAARKKVSSRTNRPPMPLFTSLRNGMQQLIERLIPELHQISLLTSAPVQSIQRRVRGGWTVSAGPELDHFDAIILAVPSHVAARLLSICSPELSAELAAIQYNSSITVALGYDVGVRRSLPRGLGFLVPRSEGRHLLAATFVHNKFPHRAPEDRALLRCFLAGADADVWQLSADDIVAIVRDELQEILGIRTEPLFAHVSKWKSAMAQYGVGHLERLDRIERLRREMPTLAFAGNGYHGIGVPDCIRSGQNAGKQVIER